MSQPFACIAALVASIGLVGSAEAQKTIVVTVEREKPNVVAAPKPPFAGVRPTVDVAILLDTSSSMDGLIKQAKSQLWTIVQQFAQAKKQGQTPVLRVALFEYGNTRLPAAEGYIRQVVPLTDDLDKLSEALFSLSTNGGDEYCGQVISEALARLDWSKEPNGYKAIFIAGNEPFTQGPVDYQDACKRAIQRSIVVNTIHCGTGSEGINGKWQHAAQLAEGESFNIDQDRAVLQIKCPQDEIIIRLNAELNRTYLWYGAKDDRRRYAENQMAQDSNAVSEGGAVAASRTAAKASGGYSNTSRDLVDALKQDQTVLGKLKEEELPDALKPLPPSQREAFVQSKNTERAEVQKKINALVVEREAYLAKEQKRLAEQGSEATLGDAVVSTIRKQLEKSGFENAPIGK